MGSVREMRYLAFLERVHELLVPPTYLEVGVWRGNSLALSRTSTIGIDPGFEIKPQHEQAVAPAALFRETSDVYFARQNPLEPFDGKPIALSFIDGMHLAEFALRDFMNIERHAHWTSVVVFDDIFPRRHVETNRDRSTWGWTGDVYKLPGILARHRRDLICLQVGTVPTGLLVVMGLDPASRVLSERYEQIARECVAPDPQYVPPDVMARRGALDPAAVLSASFWSLLRNARDEDLPSEDGLRRLRRAIRRDFSPIGRRRIRWQLLKVPGARPAARALRDRRRPKRSQ